VTAPPIRLRLDGRLYAGRAVGLPPAVPVDPVVRAVRRGADAGDSGGSGGSGEAGPTPDGAEPDPAAPTVAVAGPRPGPGHARLARLPPRGTTSVRALLAAAARSRGRTAAADEQVAALEAELASLSPPDVDVAAARRRVATAADREDRLRERVAALRGELRARRDLDADPEPVAADLADAAAALSEAETERIAARQALARAEERAREARAERDRRLALQDRLGNRRRAARRELAAGIYPAVSDALAALPGDASPGDRPAAFEGDRALAALAAVRVADLDAPVVLAPPTPGAARFGDARAAAERLDVPVIRRPPAPPDDAGG